MNTYLTLFIIALGAALFLTPVIRRLAQRRGWLDVPIDARRLHSAPIPRLGGVAIFAAMLLALLALPFVDNLVTRTLAERGRELLAVFVPATLIFLFGIFDDLRGTRARWKFLAQGVAGVLLFALGGRVLGVTLPFVGSFPLPPLLSLLVTLFWVIAISNAFNLIDGLDGLASGAALFAALVMLGVSLILGNVLVTVTVIALVGALIGFLRYNFNPASIFLGDSGSLFIGFLLAALSVTAAQKASTAVAVAIPIMAFALPVIDTGFAIARRFISGKPLFEGDREHVHHKLLERGWSQRRVVIVLYGVCALFGLIALLFMSDGGAGRLTGLVLLVTGAAVVLVAGRLRYHEVDEVRAGFRRNIVERRIRVANHVRVRKATKALAKVHTLGELFATVREMLEAGEFVYTTLQLGRAGDGELSARLLERERHDPRLRGAEVQGGMLCWAWERGDVAGSEVVESHLFWTLRLPLATQRTGWGVITFYREFGGDELLLDVNYLSHLFQRELTRAVERLYTTEPRAGMLGKVLRLSGEHLAPFRS